MIFVLSWFTKTIIFITFWDMRLSFTNIINNKVIVLTSSWIKVTCYHHINVTFIFWHIIIRLILQLSCFLNLYSLEPSGGIYTLPNITSLARPLYLQYYIKFFFHLGVNFFLRTLLYHHVLILFYSFFVCNWKSMKALKTVREFTIRLCLGFTVALKQLFFFFFCFVLFL